MTLKKFAISIFFLFAFIANVNAKWENPHVSGRVFGLTTATTFNVADAGYYSTLYGPNPAGLNVSYKNKTIVNRIVLGVDKSVTANYYASFNLNVDITVSFLDEANNPGSYNKRLRISYNPVQNVIENSQSIFEFSGALDITVTVTGIYDDAGLVPSSIANNVYLESFIQVDRYTLFNTATVPVIPIIYYSPGEFETKTFSITPISGAESYDVEWTFVDLYTDTKSPVGYPAYREYSYNFKYNSSRLTFKTNTFVIPTIYQKGIILVRVRARGIPDFANMNSFEDGKWSSPDSSGFYFNVNQTSKPVFANLATYSGAPGFFYDGFSEHLTWQRQTSFAEEGKHKQAISYFDGLLRDRQSVTKNNTENLAIVGQRVYDFVGRAAIQILPVPDAANSTLQFRPGFNKSNGISGKTYSYKDFDIDALAVCVDTRTGRLDSTTGASAYYSTNNSLAPASINKALIPNAQAYPFVQTEYMPDNTGRVRRQSGVGFTHRLTGIDDAGTNIIAHETRYEYISPAQEELDRLFGNEVGIAAHYKKQVVTDANGQQSVSYLDPQGRVIATALIGNPNNSPNMLPLDNAATKQMSIDLTPRTEVKAMDRSIEINHTFHVEDDNNVYSFDYNVLLPQYTDACLPNEICMDCIYKLQLSIKDINCDIEYVPTAYREKTLGTIDDVCEGEISFSLSEEIGALEIALPKGSYVVSKRLTIDDDALKYYKQLFLDNNTCLKTYEEFLAEEQSKKDYEHCNYTCEQCNADIEKIRIENGWGTSHPDFLAIKEGCDNLCEIKTPCFALNELMLIDMSPGGQYFNNINSGRQINPDATDPFAYSSDYGWLDNTAHITTTQKQDVFDAINLAYGVNITSWAELEENWNTEYAGYLVQYHPEYCYYLECKNNVEPSYLYDDDMLSTDDWQTAKTKGYYNPLGMTLTSYGLSYASDYITNIQDPFFSISGNGTLETGMEAALDHYVTGKSAWNILEEAMAQLGAKSCFNNYGWAAFRAIYLGSKQNFYKQYYENKCPSVSVSGGFVRRFIFDDYQAKEAAGGNNDFDNLHNSQASIETFISTKITSHCETTCTDYAEDWVVKLKGCVYVAPLTETIIKNHLIEICKKGCDLENPFGSRNISPTETYTYTDFKQVLVDNGIFVPGICDDLLIEWPMEYGHDYLAQNSPDADACACSTNKNIKNIHCPVTGPAKDTCLCTSDATTLGKQMLIGSDVAPEYKCKNCIDCYEINREVRAFFAEYDVALFNNDTALYDSIITNYLNIKFSMNLEFEDYVVFAGQCLEEDGIKPDIMSFYRLSLLDFSTITTIFRTGTSYIPSYTQIKSSYPSDIRLANDWSTFKKQEFKIDNSDKSTWMASITDYSYPYTLKDYSNKQVLVEPIGSLNQNESKFAAMAAPPLSAPACNCDAVLRANALWKTGKIRATDAQMAFQILYGFTYIDYSTKLADCCAAYTGPLPKPCDPTGTPEDYLNNPSPVFGAIPPPTGVYFADKPCPTSETECHNQEVTLDQCGCEYLMILRNNVGNGDFDNENPLLTPYYSDADLRAKIEAEMGLPIGSLPSAFDPREMFKYCNKAFQAGAGTDQYGTNRSYSVTPNLPAPPTKKVDWNIADVPTPARSGDAGNNGLDYLNEMADDEELTIPRILSCHPYCDREVYTGGGTSGGTPVPPITFLPEPPKCTSPSCGTLVDLYKEYLDSVGIPTTGAAAVPLLPSELQSEYEYKRFMAEYQADMTTANYPFIAAWAAYFPPGKQTKDILAEINASITTKLMATGEYCNVESQRPYKNANEADNFLLRLMWCLNPTEFTQSECSICLQTTDELDKVQAWLNQLAAGPGSTQRDILNKNNRWYDISPRVDRYVDIIYTGSYKAAVVQEIETQGEPMLKYSITEGMTKLFDLTLLSPGNDDKFKWANVQSFSGAQIILDKNCQPTDAFRITAHVKYGKKYAKLEPACTGILNDCYYDIEIIGFIDKPLNYITTGITTVACPPCVTLCNKPFLRAVDTTDYCKKILDDIAETDALTRYKEYIKQQLDDFEDRYVAKCLAPVEQLTMAYTNYEYHYTLYYYDQADNLIKTVPPAAVVPLTSGQMTATVLYRQGAVGATRQYPAHTPTLITGYKYNTLNQLIEQITPDGGISHFWYDRLGRLVISQNAKQAAAAAVNGKKLYSYTEYDALGRIYEVGEVRLDPADVTAENIAEYDAMAQVATVTTLLTASQTTKKQVTRTIYDNPVSLAGANVPARFQQLNMRKRVTNSFYMETWDAGNTNFNSATHYNYDVLGNVKQMVQDFPELDEYQNRYKLIEYNYDLASGKVNMVAYQPTDVVGQPKLDRFYHYYTYDADNRIIATYTSRRPAVEDINTQYSMPEISTITGWTREAKYFYYAHGPLARYEIGEEKVQGVDYAYTIHGWLKSMNAGLMAETYDPGRDGDPTVTSNPNLLIGRDAFGLELGYYQNDYIATGAAYNISNKTGSDIGNDNVDLYNGNISQMVTTIPDIAQWQAGYLTPDPSAQLYRYDQLNRLKSSRYYTNDLLSTNAWDMNGMVPNDFRMELSYDPNGNIMTMTREMGGTGSTKMDELSYNYIAGTNKLEYVTDIIGASVSAVDIDDQSAGNYDYDEIGNLIKDDAEEIETIEWTVYGKIKKITRISTSTKPDLAFEYNAAGQRIKKTVLPKTGTDGPTKDYYVRDATGNLMCLYTLTDIDQSPNRTKYLKATEYDIYGSSRVGVLNETVLLAEKIYQPDIDPQVENLINLEIYTWQYYLDNYGGIDNLDTFSLKYGYRKYELSNHLGNVQVTVTDRKLAMTFGGTTPAIDYYIPDVVSITDYYAFGMALPEKQWSAGDGYRFGFNGQEKEGDIAGEGDHVVFEYRIHDTRLGRFLSVDPLEMEYPWNSPYAFAENRVIDGIDLEGLEWKSTKDADGNSSGFEWDPKNAYNTDGTLKDGYYKTAILFHEKDATVPTNGTTFHATATVYKADGTTKDYNATTLPVDASKYGTVAAGTYIAKKGQHPMSGGDNAYPALNLYTLSGSRQLPAVGGSNPATGKTYVEGANIHKTGKKDFIGTGRNGKATSEGCPNIERGLNDVTWNDFLSNFSADGDIGVIISRAPAQPKLTIATVNSIPRPQAGSSNISWEMYYRQTSIAYLRLATQSYQNNQTNLGAFYSRMANIENNLANTYEQFRK